MNAQLEDKNCKEGKNDEQPLRMLYSMALVRYVYIDITLCLMNDSLRNDWSSVNISSLDKTMKLENNKITLMIILSLLITADRVGSRADVFLWLTSQLF